MRCARCDRHSIVVLAGYVLGAFALYWGLPEQMPPSWTVPGRGTVWLGAPMVAFLLPTAVAVTDVTAARALRQASDRRVELGERPGDLRRHHVAVHDLCRGCARNGARSALLGLLRGQRVGGSNRAADVGLHDDQHRESPSQNSPKPRDRHPHSPHAFGPCALDPSAPICGIHRRGVWRCDRPLGDCGAETRWARDDPPGWASRTRRNLASRPVFRKACPCLKEAPGKPRTAWLA